MDATTDADGLRRGPPPRAVSGAAGDPGGLRARLRAALPAAIKARDRVAVAALRSALAAVDNAEAVDAAPAATSPAQHPELAGTVVGLGAAGAERRALSDDQVHQLVRAEVADRLTAADAYASAGRQDQAARLRAEAEVLGAYLEA